jgi:HSP20 family protein
MALSDLVPWNRKDRSLALQDRESDSNRSGGMTPFVRLHQEMNRLFEDVFHSFDVAPWRQWPNLEVEETDGGYRITAELPGMEEKDVEVSFADGILTIRGEKRSQRQNDERTVSERAYGKFERRLALGDVDDSKAEAKFDKGVLTIELPRAAEARDRVKRIPVKGATTH